jgi:hypothetical protein
MGMFASPARNEYCRMGSMGAPDSPERLIAVLNQTDRIHTSMIVGVVPKNLMSFEHGCIAGRNKTSRKPLT